MAEKASKAMIISWCLMIALCIFSGALCLYFFVFNRPANEQGSEMYVRMNEVLSSKTQLDVDKALGDLDTGKCNEYVNNYLLKQSETEKQTLGKQFKSAFVCYYVDKQIIDTYKAEIVYLGNADIKNYVRLEGALDDYEVSLNAVKVYLDKFLVSYEDNVASESTQKDFAYMISDFEKLKDINHTLANTVVEYITNYYYGDVNKYSSAKYTFTYALNLQSNTAYSHYIVTVKDTATQYYLYDTETYLDTVAQVKNYIEEKTDKFMASSKDSSVIGMLELMTFYNDEYTDFFTSNCKRVYYASINASTNAGAVKKSEIFTIAKGIGLEGRLA